MSAINRTLAVAAILAMVLGVTLYQARGPAPRPPGAPPGEFSAERAQVVLRDLAGDGRPHPPGTAAHDAVRDRILGRLRALGYQPALESGYACSKFGVCSAVENITALRPGLSPERTDGKIVLLAAHYDSVAAGPGASDDGAGVAALLEVARILAAEPPRRNPVLFLIDDGEEAGLLGAEWFMARSPWAGRVGPIVNLEARGSSGESFMFETTRGNRWLIDLMSRSVPRPRTSSLFYEVYKRLPNDTDFTVFKRYEKSGLNFGYVGGVSHYHTPLDDIAHASPRSLQHHGDNALALARAFADTDLDRASADDLVWFDLFSLGIVRWPEQWSIRLAAASVLLLLIGITLGLWRLRQLPRAIGWGAFWFVSAIVLTGILAAAMTFIMKNRGAPDWVGYPEAIIASCWLIALAIPMDMAGWFGTRAGEIGLAAGPALCWSALAVAVAALLPGASYLFIPTALLLSVRVIIDVWKPRSLLSDVAMLLTVALTAAILFPLTWTLYDAMGIPILVASSLLVALVGTTWCSIVTSLPPRKKRWIPAILGAASVVSLLVALLLPAYSADSPQRLNLLVHADSDLGTTELLASVPRDDLPLALERAAEWSDEPTKSFPWYANVRFTFTGAPALELPPPRLEVVSDKRTGDRRTLRIRLRSPRSANVLVLDLRDRGRLESARAGGWLITPFSPSYRRRIAADWTRISSRSGGELWLDLVLRGTEPVEAVLEDQSFGLPENAAGFAHARGALAVPSDSGDLTIVTRRVTF